MLRTARTQSIAQLRSKPTPIGVDGSRCKREPSPGQPVEFPEAHPLIGTILDECYRVEAWMADGGMASVYRGTQLLLDRPIAIKALHHDLSVNSEPMRRFVREVRLARGLSHPNIVRVYDGGLTDDDQAYLVMEYLTGRNLAEF